MIREQPVTLHRLQAGWLQKHTASLHVLRLDEWHPVVSGNKWFKLQYYLHDAAAKGYTRVATLGGAFSNHIVATAFACRQMGLGCIGIIRGGRPPALSHTLRQAEEYGMQLRFASREAYRHKHELLLTEPGAYWISEGGYGPLGALGAARMAESVAAFKSYTHIVCATGTGTTLAGLVRAALPEQAVIGISALKNNISITEEVKQLLTPADAGKRFWVEHGYHFGGYARHTPALLQFMNDVWQEHHLPTDFVYTAKALYAIRDMTEHRHLLPAGSRILFVHTGGLQGNGSLPPGTLIF